MSDASDFVIEDGALTKYTGPGGDVVIPEGVTVICDHAFHCCNSLTGIALPTSVTHFGEWAFGCCNNLTTIVIPDSMTSIGEWAFGNCHNLTNVVIPDSVTSIGAYAFYGCSSLRSIKIPDSVTSIGQGAFSSTYITNIHLPNPEMVTQGALSGSKGLTSLIIPNGITHIDRKAFYRCSCLTSIEISGSVTSIGEQAFDSCTNLASIVIPDSVTSISDKAFSGCTGLKHIELPKEMMDTMGSTWFRSHFNKVDVNFLWLEEHTNFNARVSQMCKNAILRKKDAYASKIIQENSAVAMTNFLQLANQPIDILDHYIEDSAKKQADAVTAVLLDYKAKHFSQADVDQMEMEKVEKELGFREYSVSDWRKLFKFSTKEGKIYISAYKGTETLVTIPAKIGKNPVVSVCLYEKKSHNEELVKRITDVVLPDSVTSIGKRAFWGCSNLTSIHIPSSVTFIGVSSFGEHAFYGCHNLTIHAPAGSYAETYANECHIPFVAE